MKSYQIKSLTYFFFFMISCGMYYGMNTTNNDQETYALNTEELQHDQAGFQVDNNELKDLK